MTESHQYDIEEAIARAKEGQSATAYAQDMDWRDGYKALAEAFLSAKVRGQTFIGEDIRRHVEPIIKQPKHPNAWGGVGGAVIRAWIKDARIRSIGMQRMTRKTSHARQTPLYEVL